MPKRPKPTADERLPTTNDAARILRAAEGSLRTMADRLGPRPGERDAAWARRTPGSDRALLRDVRRVQTILVALSEICGDDLDAGEDIDLDAGGGNDLDDDDLPNDGDTDIDQDTDVFGDDNDIDLDA
jgi:hypothetical protein